MVYKEDNWIKNMQLEGAAVERGLEHGSRGIAIV
jgi:hypothetical protein